ncbi:MAG: phosphate ABC transporter substrate-binding protein PstS [Planctomycetes bacterium]|nr:phosphate ABC transporter substrate-binding protein PstS [Planctomycetota bacterium]
MFRRLSVSGILAILALVPAGCSDATRINGGGASFIYPLMLMWTKVYDDQYHIQIDYQSTGSGNGQQQTIAKTINFGCSDAVISDANLKKAESLGGPIVHVPLVMGAVVPIYNIQGVAEGMRFSGELIADMYLGKITYWDDPALLSLNPVLKLPHEKINLARRSDSSGTTAIFTDFLSKVSKEWTKEMVGTTPAWPKAVQIVGQRGNEGVAGFVQRTSNSFGYVELIYAKQNHVTFGKVRNKEGQFVEATLASVTAAAEASREGILKKHPDLRYSLTNAPGADSYPITGTNWALLYVNQPAKPGRDLVQFLRWATTFGGDGQDHARKLGYAPLPEWLATEVGKKLDSIEFID